MNCEDCKIHKPEAVPFQTHQADMARMEKSNRRWFAAWLITFVILMGSIVWFFWRESQFEIVEETHTVTQEAQDGGSNRFYGGDYYGYADGDG